MEENNELTVQYEYSDRLCDFLQKLRISVLLSTYQTGRVVCIGSNHDVNVSFSAFDKPMGIAKTDQGLVVGTKSLVWNFFAKRNSIPESTDSSEPDISFYPTQAINTGPIMGHDLYCKSGKIWVVNTKFNSICTVEPPWSFKPYWRPAFVQTNYEGDCCHLNGMAFREDDPLPVLASALGTGGEPNSWREGKANGGVVIDLKSGDFIADKLSMPHSPRYYRDKIYFLNSGEGSLECIDRQTCKREVIAVMPGFTRGLDFYAGFAFVGLSQIRETNVFGGLSISNHELRSGLSIVNLDAGKEVLRFWFKSVVEEIFSVCVLPGWTNPRLISEADNQESPYWVVPQ